MCTLTGDVLRVFAHQSNRFCTWLMNAVVIAAVTPKRKAEACSGNLGECRGISEDFTVDRTLSDAWFRSFCQLFDVADG